MWYHSWGQVNLLRSVSLPSHPDLLAEKLQTRSILTLHLVSFQGVRSEVHENLWPILKADSWQVEGKTGAGSYFLPLGPNVKPLASFDEAPLLSYSVALGKNQSVLGLTSAPFGFGGIEPYLEENTSILMEATGMEKTGTDPEGHVVLRLPGLGWDSEAPDWAAGYSLIKRAIDALEPSMDGLRDTASQALEAHLKQWPIEGENRTVTINLQLPEFPKHLGQRPPQKSFWQRLFGD